MEIPDTDTDASIASAPSVRSADRRVGSADYFALWSSEVPIETGAGAPELQKNDYEGRKHLCAKSFAVQPTFTRAECPTAQKVKYLDLGVTYVVIENGACDLVMTAKRNDVEKLKEWKQNILGIYPKGYTGHLTNTQREWSDFPGRPGVCTYDSWPIQVDECNMFGDFTDVPADTVNPLVSLSSCQLHNNIISQTFVRHDLLTGHV